MEAFRQFQFRVGQQNFCNMHVSLLPQVSPSSSLILPPTTLPSSHLHYAMMSHLYSHTDTYCGDYQKSFLSLSKRTHIKYSSSVLHIHLYLFIFSPQSSIPHHLQCSTGEQKTKPTQHSIRQLRGLGLSPDIVSFLPKSLSPQCLFLLQKSD